jgi:hypothetical protein
VLGPSYKGIFLVTVGEEEGLGIGLGGGARKKWKLGVLLARRAFLFQWRSMVGGD